MTRRLSETYNPGDRVEIRFEHEPDEWIPARVLGHDPPGMWVQTGDGRHWFVTNTARVRVASEGEADQLQAAMDEDTVNALIALSRNFYESIAPDFTRTRAGPAPGFQVLANRWATYFPGGCRRLLDAGCGEGRFGRMVQEASLAGAYVGLDSSPTLLDFARQTVDGAFYQRDLTDPEAFVDLGQFDCVTCLAVLHHIPGRQNRVDLLKRLGEVLTDRGRIILSTWQFMDSERQRRKLRAWVDAGIDPALVEVGDYLLSWGQEGDALRYVSYIDPEALTGLASDAGLGLVDSFRSDGQEGDLNLYGVLALT